MTTPLLLIDGSSYFYRAFHALPPLTTTSGQPTGAIYGVVNMVKRLMHDYQSLKIAVIFDAKGKTFRNDWYPDYKAHRIAMPNELRCQFNPLVDLLTAMGLPPVIIEGVEADDVIGTIAYLAIKHNQPVVISTSDKDLAQLVNNHITLINTMTHQRLDTQGVLAKFGVMPSQIVDYLTLVGDQVDNIPGVTKCGPKTAVKWLQQYHTLDNLVAHHTEISGKIGDYLRASLDFLPLSRRLITIKTDVKLPFMLADLKQKAVDEPKLLALTKELEFKSWFNELMKVETPKPISQQEHVSLVTVITTETQFIALCKQLINCQYYYFKLYTTHIDSMLAEIVGIALAIEPNSPIYIPIAHESGESQLTLKMVLEGLKPLLEHSTIGKIGYDLKVDYTILQQLGIKLQTIIMDVMLQSYVLNSHTARHDLDTLALTYMHHKIMNFEEIAGKGSKQLNFSKIAIESAARFAGEQVSIGLTLYHHLSTLLVDPLTTVLSTIEMPLLTVLADIERYGVLIDTTILATHGERLKTRIQSLEEQALKLAGKPFNLNSPKQLQDILFTEQQLPIISRTPTGQPSTAESVLQELAADYPLPATILEYRSLTKLVSTYIDALPKRKNITSQRVHTCYNQAITVTGRLSSSEPNLQNIPIRSDEGRLIRKAFIAPNDKVLIAADYSQIELRIMAHLSADLNLLNAFSRGLDIHMATASDIFHLKLDEVTHEHRRRAKAVNFGLIYGMSAFGLAKQLGVARYEAEQYMASYFDRYPNVLAYMEKTRKLAHKQGYVETIFGRRLSLPEINARNMMSQRAAERMAINAPMQGSAADIIKKAMIAIYHWHQSTPNCPATMIMQVHDELVFEVTKKAVDDVLPILKNLMENTVQLAVPLVVSMGVGNNWDEAH
jgi:DNA polymerase-1